MQDLSLKSEIDQILRERIDKDKKIVGLVVGIVNEEGTSVFSYGKLRQDSDQKPDGDTIF